MKSIWTLTKKNLILLLRAKKSSLIVVLAPLLIILILGLSYNTSDQYNLKLGIHSTSFTEDVNSLINSLQEENFKVIKYESNVEECINDLKLGIVNSCLSVPESFKIESNEAKKVTFYIDPSKINLVWMIQETLQKKLNLQSQQVSEELTQNILTKLNHAKTSLTENLNTIKTTKDKSSSTSNTINSIKTSLTNIDLTSLSTTYNLSIINEFNNEMKVKINGANSKVSSALTAVNNSNLTSTEKNEIINNLNGAESRLDNAFLLINGDGDESFIQISKLVDSLMSELDYTKLKLDAAAEASNNIGIVTTSIQDITTSLTTIEIKLNEIQANLEQKVNVANIISNPLQTEIIRISERNTYLDFTFSTLLIMVIMFSSLLLGTTLVMMEKHSPAFFRNSFIPIRKINFIFSIYLTNLILILLQIIVILGVSLFFIKNALNLFPQITLILFITASVFTFIGMSIGYIFSSEETGVLAAISAGSLFLFISGTILPLESVSPLLRNVTHFNPFVIAEKIIREILVFNTPLSNVWISLGILIGYALIFFFIILMVELMFHQHLIKRYSRLHRKKHLEKFKQTK